MMQLRYFFLIVFFANPILANSPNWFVKIKQIKLLSTNRSDLIKMFGQPESQSEFGEYFNSKGVRLSFSYSIGKCKNGWNIDKGVVFEIAVFPIKPISPSSIGVNLKKFEFYKESDTPNIIYYNDVLGEKYITTPKGKISEIWYSPPDKYDYLLCQK